MIAPDPSTVARFRHDLEALTGPLGGGGALGLAVSGGPDSLAMLLLAGAAFPGEVIAATVDHGLRPESAAEAGVVAGACAALGVPHDTLNITTSPDGASLQRWARAERYAALAAWAGERGIALVATAHHLDDQAETFLMRLDRGSGVGGLAGIRARGAMPAPGARIDLVRPLLGWRRSELAAAVADAGIEPVRDPSNEDERFDRARMRRRIADNAWLDPLPLARSAAALAEADEALAWMIRHLAAERVVRDGPALLLRHAGLPAELRRRLLVDCLAALVPEAAPRGAAVSALLADLDAGKTATLAAVKCSGGDSWRFELAPARREGPGGEP